MLIMNMSARAVVAVAWRSASAETVEGGILVRGNMAAMIAGVVAVVAAASSWCTRVSYKCGKSLSLLSSACNTLVTPTPPCGQTSFR